MRTVWLVRPTFSASFLGKSSSTSLPSPSPSRSHSCFTSLTNQSTSWINKWFDPTTVSKIFILSDSQVFTTLSRFIDPCNIPVAYGGTLNWEYGDDLPVLDERAKEVLGMEGMPGGSVRWVKGELVWKGKGRSEEEEERIAEGGKTRVPSLVETGAKAGLEGEMVASHKVDGLAGVTEGMKVLAMEGTA